MSADELSGNARTDIAGSGFACSLSPNPSEHHFVLNIRTQSSERIYIHILDARGKVLRSMEAGNRQTILLGEDLAPGIYVIDVMQGSEHRVLKAIKQ